MPTRSGTRLGARNEPSKGQKAKTTSTGTSAAPVRTSKRYDSEKNAVSVTSTKFHHGRRATNLIKETTKRGQEQVSSVEKDVPLKKKRKGFAETRSSRPHLHQDHCAGRVSPRRQGIAGRYLEQAGGESSSDEKEIGARVAMTRSHKAKLKHSGKVVEKEPRKVPGNSKVKKPAEHANPQKEGIRRQPKEDTAESSNEDLEHSSEGVGDNSSDSEIVFLKTPNVTAWEEKEDGEENNEVSKMQEAATAKVSKRQAHSRHKLKSLSLWSKDKVVDERTLVKDGRTQRAKQQAIPKIVDVDEIESSETTDSDIKQLSEDGLSDDENDLGSFVMESDSDIEEVAPSFNVRHTSQKSAMEATVEENLKLKKAVQLLEKKLATLHRQHTKKLQKKDEELKRIRNQVEWKDEQMEELSALVEKNMELEAKLSLLVSNRKAYEEEIEKIEKEKEERLAKEKKKKEHAEESKKLEDEQKRKKQVEDEEEQVRRGKKKRRSMRRKKGEDASDGEDIDALFVDDQIVIDDNDDDKDTDQKKDDDIVVLDEMKGTDKEESQQQEEGEDSPNKQGRKDIRKLMTGKKLTSETVAAAKAEKERRDRVKKEHEKHEKVEVIDPKTKQPLTTKLVLAFEERTKKPLVEVNSKLIRKLKPHQVEAVEFMWDNLIESIERYREEGNQGGGCILAHCMGLGKTLSVIALVHTLLMNDYTDFTSCLVVCPLNTVLNWNFEWEKWFPKRDRLPVYELANAKSHPARVALLKDWQKSGGIMIMGYHLFRILANYSGKSKKTKAAFHESLIDPGPDLVICDEGHTLKNDASAISKAMSRIKTRRRVVLTGTPLQNNLIEYHCMVDFVKPNLLGTRREFSNRFVNPITNGQHKDSTSRDVKVMKRRAHVLHEMLNDCVQRRDYSCLTKLLPMKHEYVISVRLSKCQIELYQKYLDLHTDHLLAPTRGASLFSDYQTLMRIWTHPWVLKLEEARQAKKGFSDDDDDELESILYTSSSDEEDEEIVEDEDTENTTDSSEMQDDEEEEDEEEKRVFMPRRSARRSGVCKDKAFIYQQRRALETVNEDSASKETEKIGTKSVEKTVTSKDKVEKKKGKVDTKTAEKPEKEKQAEGTACAAEGARPAKVIAGEVIKRWQSASRGKGMEAEVTRKAELPWWHSMVDEKHEKKVELSGKLMLLFKIIRMCEQLGDKVLVFSQSILSLDLIELFMKYKTEEAEEQKTRSKKSAKPSMWVKDEDYLRMDGSTAAHHRKRFTTAFNDTRNKRLRVFLISTRAGGLGINLEAANRVIIFDASWNPSHDIQSIFRVYRFGQEKAVYVYRFLAQGTMEEKIYERQVTKETLSQRVIDEHQIDRHFTASDLQELYNFKPDRLDDPDAPQRPTPAVPKDVILAELLSSKDWIVDYHEHDSLLENRPEENLTEEERKAAWEEYEKEKAGFYSHTQYRPTPQYDSYNMYNNALHYGQPRLPGMETQQPLSRTSLLPPVPNTGHLPVSHQPVVTPLPPNLSAGKLNFQLAQLPRVVQEILKYNPTISADELQNRLQAFLGMHARYTPPQGLAAAKPSVSVTPVQAPSVPTPGTSTATYPLARGVPASYVAPPGRSPMDLLMNIMPSRLPQPGTVPASKRA